MAKFLEKNKEFDKEKGSKIPTRIACVRTLNEIPLVMEKKIGNILLNEINNTFPLTLYKIQIQTTHAERRGHAWRIKIQYIQILFNMNKMF